MKRNSPWVRTRADRRPGIGPNQERIASVYVWQGNWNYNFWSNLEIGSFDSELDRIVDLGFNTIGLTLPWGLFQPSACPIAYDDDKYELLDQVIRMADRRGLWVVLRVGSHEHLPLGIAGTNYHTYKLFLDDDELTKYFDLFRETARRLSRRANVLCLMYSWEDTYTYLDVCRRSLDRRHEIARNGKAFTEYLQRRPLWWWNMRWGSRFRSYADIPIPEVESIGFRDLLLFHDERQRTVILPSIARAVERGAPGTLLSHEVRVDPDPYRYKKGYRYVRHERSWKLPPDFEVLAATFSPSWGAPNDGKPVSPRTAADNLSTLLDRLARAGSRPLYLSQLVATDSTPGVEATSTLARDDVDGFLELALPIIERKAAGYGFWSLEPYSANLLCNSSFENGLEAWTTAGGEGAAVDTVVDAVSGSRFARLPARSSLMRTVKALWNPGAMSPDSPFRLVFRARGPEGSTLGLRWSVLDPGSDAWRLATQRQVSLEPVWRRYEMVLPFAYHFSLQFGAEGPGGADLDSLELANHVQTDAALPWGEDLSGDRAALLRRHNRRFIGRERESATR